MSRSSIGLRAFSMLLLVAVLVSNATAQEEPHRQRLDDTGVAPAPGALPCGVGVRLPPGAVQRESTRPGATIDACGHLHLEPGATPGTLTPPLVDAAATANARIDSMQVYASIFGYQAGYSPGGNISLIAHAERYYLDNGTSWQSGAGSLYPTGATLNRVEVTGNIVRYVLNATVDGVLYKQTDFDSGDHSSQGELAVYGTLVIEARLGETTGMLSGQGRVVSNTATWYGEPRFNFFSAPVGSLVPFRMRYQLVGTTFTQDLFTRSFSYTGTGAVDFVHATRPPLVALQINGPSRIPDAATTDYRAIARYETGALEDVTATAVWTVTPTDGASIAAGRLTVGTIPGVRSFTLHASYDLEGVHREDDHVVTARHDFLANDPNAWPTYQADSRHTGFLPVTPTLTRFRLLWERNLGQPLNPVAGGDGRVYCTPVTYFGGNSPLQALDAKTGATLWSYNFGSVFSVNPPSYAYGNVYVQSGNHGTDTWLHAFEGATGERLFKSPHEAQWERYYAPTAQDGTIYVNGGYYGGMYAFDALTGQQRWFRSLPQYDQWTPGVAGDHAYSYVGSYSPGLYALRRSDGQLAFMIPDPGFDWDGWSMNQAPVVGAHDDVITIHDGRLISFDIVNRRIRWEVTAQFSGQASLANGVLYALDFGALVALDERTGARLWSWKPAGASLRGPFIVTANMVFVASAAHVHAMDLDSRTELWSYPASGSLSIANGALYIAGGDGKLTAIDIAVGPPLVAHAGADTTVECTEAEGGTHVMLDGRGSEGPDLTFQWAGAGVTFDDPSSPTPTGTFPMGTTAVVLTVSRDGTSDRDSVLVTVVDTALPGLALAFQPPMLWPPDNRLVHVRVIPGPRDACDTAPTVTLRSVVSNQPDGGSGDAFPDDILDASSGQADFDVWLRAQRTHGAGARVYTLCYQVADDAGHVLEKCATLLVPKSGGRAALQAAGTPRLTIYGEANAPTSEVEESSVVVSSAEIDAWRVVPGTAVYEDVDGDRRMDRTWDLARVELPASVAAPTTNALFARWQAVGDAYYAALDAGGVTAVETDRSAFQVGLGANPARGLARFRFHIPKSGPVRLTIYDLAGRSLARVVDRWVEAGAHEVDFDSKGLSSSTLLYYRFEYGSEKRGGRFVLLR